MKKSKFKNEKEIRIVNGKLFYFDSKKEARRYDELYLLLKAKKIHDLILQPEFIICESLTYKNWKKSTARKYIADFSYFEKGNLKQIVEDVKGFRTDMYILKRHLFLYKFGNEIDFREI